jgi:uncharacterized membrane protein
VVNVPSQYDTLIKQMSSGTGIPYNVIAEQANVESGFSANAVSSAGAEGWLQFEPSTYDAVASRAGVKPGSEFDPASEAKAYTVYMNDLLKQEGGNLRNTLAAYNAGPGNLAAGYSYADKILNAAGQGNTTVTSNNTSSGIGIPGVGGISVSGLVQSAVKALLGMFGLSDLKDMLERAGLIILGFALVIMGIRLLGQQDTAKTQVTNYTGKGEETETETKSAAKKSTAKTGAGEAVEAAAVA